MHIVEVFLPLDKGNGTPVDMEMIERCVAELAERFGGATAFTRAPAEGLWKQESGIQKDRIIVVEVMMEEVDGEWWKSYRSRLETEFQQDEVMIRVTPCWKI
jgi:2-hydroxychromene-2-carboxylate isomerase